MTRIGGNQGGGGGDFPKPDPGNYTAALAAVYDIGVHRMSYPGQEVSLSQRLVLVWELDAQGPDGKPFQVVDEVPTSLYKSSKMREAASALLDRPVGEDEEMDTDELLGKCARLVVIVTATGFVKIDRRDALQDQSRVISVQGSYGPNDAINRLVAWKMRQAEADTVPAGQGIMPKAGKGKTADAGERVTAPEAGTTNGAQDDDTDLPF